MYTPLKGPIGPELAKAGARDAIKQLRQSPRGRRMLEDLLKFVTTDYVGADQFNKRATIDLMAIAACGYVGRIIDAMEDVPAGKEN